MESPSLSSSLTWYRRAPTQAASARASSIATVRDSSGHDYPALVVQRFGAGRVGALMIGDLWRWGMRRVDPNESDLERMASSDAGPGLEKRGAFTGSYVINPFTNEPVPVYVADYVLGNYGTGAIMAVPAEDERDFAFATVYGLRG